MMDPIVDYFEWIDERRREPPLSPLWDDRAIWEELEKEMAELLGAPPLSTRTLLWVQ